MNRFETLFNLIGSGEVFADVGCDHGYISEMVIKNGKYKKVILSDISSKSLEKAVNLLSKYGDRVKFVVSDGFESYDEIPNEAIIAGMGGEEIIKILSGKILPDSLVLAPQKNTYKVRRFLLDNGINVKTVYLDGIDGSEEEDFGVLKTDYPDLILHSTIHVSDRRPVRSSEKILAVGQKAAWFEGTEYFVNMIEGGGLYGFEGIAEFIRLMEDAFENAKDLRDIVPRKGLGCRSCI